MVPRFVGLPFHLFLPLFAAIIYVVAALLLKRASDLGADVWRSTRIINYTQALMAVPFWLLGGTIPSSSLWWQPVVAGLLFFAGQVFTLLALTTGDVSVATPVLGLKIVLVALLSVVLIGDPIGARLWTAAALSSIAIALLNLSPGHSHRRVARTIVFAALGAAAYASFRCAGTEVLPRVGDRAASCRWRWPAAPRIHSRYLRAVVLHVVPTFPPPPRLRRTGRSAPTWNRAPMLAG
jgi:drug/metabolite transporter (DMT)-like permease